MTDDRTNLKMDTGLHTQHKGRKDTLEMTWDEYLRWLLTVTQDLEGDEETDWEAGRFMADLEIDTAQLATQVARELAEQGSLLEIDVDMDEDMLGDLEVVNEDALAEYVAERTSRQVVDTLHGMGA